MCEIIKVLNNNTILVSLQEDEGVVISKGIGFGKKNGDNIEIPRNAKLYLMQKMRDKQKINNIINDIEAVYIEIAGEVLKYAEEKFWDVSDEMLIPLALVLFFAVKEVNDSRVITENNNYDDVHMIYPTGYKLALKAREVIKQYTSIVISDDQVNYIAIHLNSQFLYYHADISKQLVDIVKSEIYKIEKDLDIKIDFGALSFIRLLRHLRFKANDKRRELVDVNDYCKEKYSYAYKKAETIVEKIREIEGFDIQESEIGYLTIHIEEIILNSKEDHV